MPSERLLSVKELALYIGTSISTLRRLRAEGIFPAYRIRTRIKFKLEEVLAALARCDEEYPIRKREALIPSGGPEDPVKARFKIGGLTNLTTVDINEEEVAAAEGKGAKGRKSVKGVQSGRKQASTKKRAVTS